MPSGEQRPLGFQCIPKCSVTLSLRFKTAAVMNLTVVMTSIQKRHMAIMKEELEIFRLGTFKLLRYLCRALSIKLPRQLSSAHSVKL